MIGITKQTAAPGATWCEDLPVPEVGPGEVLVKVKATAICGTDLHIYDWTPWAQARIKPPMVFGHEFAGEIVEVGQNVTGFKVGDRVAGETHISCGNCYFCQTGDQHICADMKIIGVHVPGSFAEYISIPVSCAWKVSPSVSYEDAAFLEPLGVAIHGVLSGEIGNQTVAIFGCGPIGLMGINVASASGANQIFAIEPIEEKVNLAKEMGATTLLRPGKDDVLQAVMDATNGIGVDVVIDFSGSAKAIQSGLQILRKGGRMTLTGLPNLPVELDLVDGVIYKEARINGTTGRRMYETWLQADKLFQAGKLNLDPAKGGTFALKDFEQAFAAIKAGKPGKMVLIP